jgi:lipopolysaccharide export LptBFGC system permease protein LptF
MVVYALGFLGLIAIAITVPLIRGGAPLLDVLLFIPNQLAFPATLVIPLALLSGVLSTISRLREDGELTALMASGISSSRLVIATLPLVIITMMAVGYLAHVLMPEAYKNFYQGKNSLLRQAVATQIARKEPFHQRINWDTREQMTLAAMGAEGQRLKHVFAFNVDAEQQLWVGYAPSAQWSVQQPDGDNNKFATSLQLDLADGRFIKAPYRGANNGELAYPLWAGSIPTWNVGIDQEARSYTHRSEVKTTAELSTEISVLRQGLVGKDLSVRANGEQNKVLRDRQLFYHTRYLLTFGLIPWWLFAIGLGLSFPARNRLGAIAVGVLSVVISVLPGFAVVKGMRGQLLLNPAYLLYIPTVILLIAGVYLLYRRR